MSRTYKQEYTKSKRFDKTCRNHGTCSYCKSNRTYKNSKYDDLKDLIDEYDFDEYLYQPSSLDNQ